jgi:hypothetical protein
VIELQPLPLIELKALSRRSTMSAGADGRDG